ncbi:MAG: hypothetical protein ACYDCC_02690 [Actinomycetota bacterium]
MIEVESGSAEPFFSVVRNRGRRRRVASIASTTVIAVLLASATGYAVASIRKQHSDVVPSSVVRVSSINIDAEAQVSNVRLHVNEIFTITARMTTYSGVTGWPEIDTGDHHPLFGVPSSDNQCLSKYYGPTPERRTGRGVLYNSVQPYAYRYPGTYRITVHFRARRYCDAPDEEPAPIVFRVVVSGGPIESSGPMRAWLPSAILGQGPIDPAGLTEMSFSGDLLAPDSWIDSVTIDWGDGTRTFRFPLSQCKDPGSYWPSLEPQIADKHMYRKGGDHEIKLFIQTSGCDGASSALTVITHRFTMPVEPAQTFGTTFGSCRPLLIRQSPQQVEC